MHRLFKTKTSASLAILGAIVLFGGSTFGSYSLLSMSAKAQAESALPKFSLDPSPIPEWWSGGNHNAQAQAIPGEYNEQVSGPINHLPVADMSIHHGKPGDNQHYADNCFVAVSYYDYHTDAAAAYREYETNKDKWGTLTQVGDSQQVIATDIGSLSYELRSYHYTGQDGSQDTLDGYQIGFATLPSGHIRIEGVCKTPTQLDLTLPVLSAIQLDLSSDKPAAH